MIKDYDINGKQIKTLNELLEIFCSDFSNIFDYFSNDKLCANRFKKLIAFIKGFDKSLGNKINDIIINTKYLHNTITFIIFELSEHKLVIINGKEVSFQDFLAKLRQTGKDDKTYMTFIEDNGISKTYGKIIEEPNFQTNMYVVERNIENDFAFDYLISYYDYPVTNSVVKTTVLGIVVNNEENFFRSEQAFRNRKFLLNLAHKTNDLAGIIDIIKSKVYTFKVAKMLYGSMDSSDLLKLFSGAFYDWMLENFLKYKYKGPAKKIKDKYKGLLTDYKKAIKNYSDESAEDFYRLLDIENKLYSLYGEFIVEYNKKRIIAIDSSLEMSISYCSTLICQNYIESSIINLKNSTITGDEDFVSESTSRFMKYDEKLLKKQRKLFNKLGRFSIISVVLSIILLIAFVIIFAIGYLNSMDSLGIEYLDNFISSIPVIRVPSLSLLSIDVNGFEISDLYAIMLLSSLITLILAIITRILSSHGKKSILNYISYYSYKDNMEKLSKKQEKIFKKLAVNPEKLEKKIKRSHRISGALCMTFFTLALTGLVITICNIALLDVLEKTFKFDGKWSQYCIAFGPGLALVYGLVKKKKGLLTPIMLIIFAVGGVVISCLI